MNSSTPTDTPSPLSPASLLASLRARSINALKAKVFNFSDELSQHFENTSPDSKKNEPEFDQVIENNTPEKLNAEGSSGRSVIPGTQKTVFNEIRRGILIRRRRKANSLFAGEISHASVALESQTLYQESSIAQVEERSTKEFFSSKYSDQEDIAKFRAGLDNVLEQRKIKKVTFAVGEVDGVIESEAKLMPPTLLRVNRVNQRSISNERSFNNAFRNQGERLNSDNLKQNAKGGIGSSALAQRHEDMLNARPREVRMNSRESQQVNANKDFRASQSVVSDKIPEIVNSRESSPNIRYTELAMKKALLTKFPFISSPPIKGGQRSSLPSSPEKTSRGFGMKKDSSLLDKEMLAKIRGNAHSPYSPYIRELMDDKKALEQYCFNFELKKKGEKKAGTNMFQNAAVTRNVKFYLGQKVIIESRDERKHGFPMQKESKLIMC